jgi:galactose mutarotase-like enzyme
MITLRTATIEVDIDDKYGATIVRIADAQGRNALAHYDWESPQPASRGLSYGNDDLDFHSGYRGGWQETFPNAGLPAVVDGVPLPFHGEAATASWTIDSVSDARCELHVPARLPLVLRRTMELDSEQAVLRISGEVENVGQVPAEFVWGQHPAFPAMPGARIDFPRGARIRPDVKRAAGLRLEPTEWPQGVREGGGLVDLSIVPDGDIHELFYLDNLDEGWAAIRQPAGGVSVALAWDVQRYPFSWLWIMRGDPGFPFYGRAHMMAIEAQTAWPYDGLGGAKRRGMVHRLAPGETLRSWHTCALFEDRGAPVTGVNRDGVIRFGEDGMDG